jgi:hypothetical protein
MKPKFIVPFKHEPKNRIATIGNEHDLGAIELPQYGMLLPGEKIQIEEANLITADSRNKEVGLLAQSIFDRLPGCAITATKIDLMIRELQDGYQQPGIPAEIADKPKAIAEFLEASLTAFEAKIASHREILAEFMGEIIAQSKHFAQENLRRFEVYATVIASERISGFQGITYEELCEAFKSKELIDRLGLFGIWEDAGVLYSETDYAKNDAQKPVAEPLVERTEAELAK